MSRNVLGRSLFAIALLFALRLSLWSDRAHAPAQEKLAEAVRSDRDVYLAGELAEDDLLCVSVAVAGGRKPGILLVDSPVTLKTNEAFITTFKPNRVVPVGTFTDGVDGLERRLGSKPAAVVPAKRGNPGEDWKGLHGQADRVVLCPAEPRRLLLQAACLAGVLDAPLILFPGEPTEVDELRRQLTRLKPVELYAVDAAASLREVPGQFIPLADEAAVVRAYLQQQLKYGPIDTLVVANPADGRTGRKSMATLAPWVTLQRRAALLLTNDAGDNATALLDAALASPELKHADTLLIVADLKAVPMEQRINPVPGKDKLIEMEPGTPKGTEPFSFATGRLFHENPAVLPLQFARQRLLAEQKRPRRALVVSNPGEGLPLLETFSRHTALELRNSGYRTTALFGEDVTKDSVRKQMAEEDIFLWEGHYKTLINQYEFLTWKEPLQPSLIFLQSCLALNEKEAQPLLQRGAVAIVGSSTRTYSATGGAFTLAFFDALLYENETLGGSMRQAKNFLLAYSLLKDKRLGDKAKLSGVNVRSSWAFSLWGDPTLRLPTPAKPDTALPGVRHKVDGNTITITLPETSYDQVKVEKYEAQMLPNSRLAGLLSNTEDEMGRKLVPFVFFEVPLPQVPVGKTPYLLGKTSEKNWVFCWDPRRTSGYVLLTPRNKETHKVRFQVAWDE